MALPLYLGNHPDRRLVNGTCDLSKCDSRLLEQINPTIHNGEGDQSISILTDRQRQVSKVLDAVSENPILDNPSD